jgi:hypothetical protein
MAPRPTVIGSRVIGVDLPAFLLSKNFYSESIGMSRTAALQLPRMIALGLCLVGLTHSLLRELAFQLCLPQLALSFCLVFKSFATRFGIPLRKLTTRHSLLFTAAK